MKVSRKVVRRWLTSPRTYSPNSFILIDYKEMYVKISDCDRKVRLEFDVESWSSSGNDNVVNEKARKVMLKKLDNLIQPLVDFRKYLEEVE